jgi:hypothetical protein
MVCGPLEYASEALPAVTTFILAFGVRRRRKVH